MAKTIEEVEIKSPEVSQVKAKLGVIENVEQVVTRRSALFLSVSSFIISMFFLSRDVTGNVIGDLGLDWMNLIGAILFILAMFGFLYYFRTRKKPKNKKRKNRAYAS